VEVIRSGLESLAEQMTDTMTRTSYSTLLKEGKDCSSSIFDAAGRLIAEGANVPIHLNALGPCLRAMLKDHFPPESFEPGDVILTNDPYVGGSLGAHHTADFIVYHPIFHDDELVGFSTIFAHLAGAGGIDPEGWHRSIYDEGLRIPPVKLFSRGTLDTDLLNLILDNTNAPYAQRADILSQVAGVRVGAQGYHRLIERYGKDDLYAAIDSQIAYAERRTRAHVRKLPDGRYETETTLLEDGSMGGPIRLALAVTIDSDRITFDFTGTSPAFDGPINCPLSATISACLYGLLALMPPDIPKNEGPARVVDVIAPEGSLVNPRLPAAVYQRMFVAHQIVDAIFAALAPAAPEAVVADSCGLIYARCTAINRDTHPRGGDVFGRHEWRQGTGPSTGGLGARASSDGLTGMPGWITNVASPSIEAVEVGAPVLFLRKEIRNDSGGPGRHRGGLGLVLSWESRGHDGEFSHSSQHSLDPPRGLFGGGTGARGQWVLNEGTPREQPLEHQVGPTRTLEYGDTVTLYAPGGGGYGDPLDRPADAVRDDYLRGYISKQSALEHYGVVIDAAGTIDAVETGLVRRSARAARGVVH
jgi:N-methylhydantoinase B